MPGYSTFCVRNVGVHSTYFCPNCRVQYPFLSKVFLTDGDHQLICRLRNCRGPQYRWSAIWLAQCLFRLLPEATGGSSGCTFHFSVVIKIAFSCEIEDFVATHMCIRKKLRYVLRLYMLSSTSVCFLSHSLRGYIVFRAQNKA